MKWRVMLTLRMLWLVCLILTVLPAEWPARGLQDASLGQTQADRIAIDELKAKMERKEKILIIDARAGSSYLGSSVKIRGAFHLTLDDLESSQSDLGVPVDREIIIYCT